jgi:effector-binding domain-containing protein
MKFLKVIGIIVLILIAIFLAVPYFLADNVVVSDTELIKAKPETIFRQVNNYHNWSNWSPFESDPTMVNTYEGPEQGVGAIRTWVGEKAGEGTMQIEVSEPYTYIQNKLVFGPGEGGGTGSWNFIPTEDGVEVEWTVHVSDLNYPMGRWFGLLTEPMLKPMLESGLAKLKEVAEALPEPPEVKIVNMEAIPSLVIYDSTTIEGMGEMFSRNYKALYSYVKSRSIPITGEQFAIYHNWNPEGITKISAGIPVAAGSKGKNNIKYYEIPAGNVLFATHTGGYNSAPAHEAIDAYIKDFNLKTKDYIWETYMYNTEVNKDTSTYVTFIYYPLD